MIIGAVASLVGIAAIGLTIWGVKKYLDGKDPDKNKNNEDEINKEGNGGNDEKGNKEIKSKKKNVNGEGYDYIEEVNKRLSVHNKKGVMKTFNIAANVIKNNKFSDEETKQLAEFLKVVKGEKKVLENSMLCGAFAFSENKIYVDLDDGMTYGLYFGISHFEIQKFKGTEVIYNLKLNYN